MEKIDKNKYIKQSVNNFIDDGDYEEAIKLVGQSIEDIISNEIEEGQRQKWIDSFNNNTQIIFTLVDIIDEQNEEKKKRLEDITKKIQLLSSNIFKRVESEEVGDANEEERAELVGLVHELRKNFVE
ncbi:MAG: hypothetical protein WCV55_03255 [Candidatus Paceibacterota bacterium]